eukprot:360202-Chlamydomonas_euryale.AAC.10
MQLGAAAATAGWPVAGCDPNVFQDFQCVPPWLSENGCWPWNSDVRSKHTPLAGVMAMHNAKPLLCVILVAFATV